MVVMGRNTQLSIGDENDYKQLYIKFLMVQNYFYKMVIKLKNTKICEWIAIPVILKKMYS